MSSLRIIDKYGKRFANTDKHHVTRGVRYEKDGTVIVTNRHYLLRIRDAHSLKSAITLDPKTGIPVEGTYPNSSKLFPTTSQHEIVLPSDLSDVLVRVGCAMDVAKRLDKKIPIVNIVGEDGLVNLEIKSNTGWINFKAFLGGSVGSNNPFHVKLNAEYLHTALRLFHDAGSDVKIKINGRVSPVLLTNEKDIDVIILPYRVEE